jgi:hypothetical protein
MPPPVVEFDTIDTTFVDCRLSLRESSAAFAERKATITGRSQLFRRPPNRPARIRK